MPTNSLRQNIRDKRFLRLSGDRLSLVVEIFSNSSDQYNNSQALQHKKEGYFTLLKHINNLDPKDAMLPEAAAEIEYTYKPLKAREEVQFDELERKFLSFKIIIDPRDYDSDEAFRPSELILPRDSQGFRTVDHHGSFRLVSLKPSRDLQSAIEISIQHHEIHLAPAYEAVSYTWGPPPYDMVSIGTDEGRLKITRSLAVLLRHVRLEDKDRLLWIDQISIDQSNYAEKSEQVPKMSLIYKRATRSLVWLGEETALSERGMKLVDGITQKIREGLNSQSHEGLEQACLQDVFGLRTWAAEDWKVLRALFCDHPIWTRIWIVQELILAEKITFMCGRQSVLWIGLMTLSVFMATLAKEKSNEQVVDNLERVTKRILCILDYRTRNDMAKKGYSRPDLGLRYLLNYFQDWQATNERDMVYGLLGLNTGPKIPCNYNLSLDDLNVQVVKALILHESSLHIICSSDPEGQCSVSLPSWCPHLGNWTVEPLPWNSWGSPTASKQEPWNSAPILNPDNSLFCQGRYAGTITRLGEVGSIEGSFYEWQKRTWSSLPSDSECINNLDLPQGRESDAIWRTLIQDLDARGQRLNPEKILAYQAQFEDWNRTIADEGELPYNAPEFVRATMFPTKFMRTGIVNLKFFVTVYKGAELGDVLSFLAGAPRPMVLRPVNGVGDERTANADSGERYTVIGPAYWYGLMDGEARNKVEFPKRNFILV